MVSKSARLVILFLATLSVAADTPNKDLEPFQGVWAVESITKDGTTIPANEAQRLVLVVKGNERLVKDGDEIRSKATFTIDPSKTPKHMDIMVSDGPLAGKTLRGIYELKGGRLSICLLLEGEGRPDDLTAKIGSNRLLQVYEKSSAKTIKDPELRTALLARKQADQKGRLELLALLRKGGGKLSEDTKAEFQTIAAKLRQTDDNNLEWLKGIVKKHGWPGFTLVGKDGAEAAFIIVEHAVQDPQFQEQCLELLAAAVQAKEAHAIHLAYLTDRVRVAAGKRQVYGSQLEEMDGDLVIAPIEEEENVDQRRKALGLPPLAEYLNQARRDRGLPLKK